MIAEKREYSMFASQAKILFQGDSITDGNRTRDEDPNHVMGHGYAFLIASRLGFDYADRGFQFFNRGISGNRIVDLFGRWKEDTLNLKPDILSILIGVNDVNGRFWDVGVSAKKFEQVYDMLLTETKEELPHIQLVICEPFILPVGRVKENLDYFTKEIKLRQEAAKRIAEKHGAIYIPLQADFEEAAKQAEDTYWMWDGIHPTTAGHELIARKWLQVVGEHLNK
jgi:lysophospholipase L1-like esterase